MARKHRRTLDERIAEETGPPNSRHELGEVTIDLEVLKLCKAIYARECEHAQIEDRPEPKWSHTIEMLLRKGIRAYGPITPLKHETSSA